MKWLMLVASMIMLGGIADAEDYTVALSTNATQETTISRMYKRACSAAASAGETSYAGCTITDGVCVSCSPSVGERETYLLGILTTWLTTSQNTLIGAELSHILNTYPSAATEDQDTIKGLLDYAD